MEYSFSSTRAADEDLEAFLNENVVPLPNGDYLISTLNAECTINNDDETNPDTRVSSAAKRMAANVRSNILRDNVASLKISTFSILGRSIVRACRDHEKDLIILAYPSSGKSTMVAISIIEEVVIDFHSDEWVFERNASCTQITPLIVHLLPTKEGVDQITGLYEAICKRTGLKIAKCYGGGNRDDNDEQLDSLQHADVIVATPGRLYDLFENGYIFSYVFAIFVSTKPTSYCYLREKRLNNRMIQRATSGHKCGITQATSSPPYQRNTTNRHWRMPAMRMRSSGYFLHHT